jgi:exopolysaccharide biosynthesis protein
MNLDGGGSTTAVGANGRVINRDGDDVRVVSNALIVVPKPTAPPTPTPGG